MSEYYIYEMRIINSDEYYGSYIGQHKIGLKDPSCDGYKGSGSVWRKQILQNHIPVEKHVIKICNNLEEANYWERFYIAQAREAGIHLWNIADGGGCHEHDRIYTADELQAHNRERYKRWYAKNKEHYREYNKAYRDSHKELFKKIRDKCRAKEGYAEYARKYYQDNKERFAPLRKAYYEKNKERFCNKKYAYDKQYRIDNAEKEAERRRKYYQENKEKKNKYYEQCCYYEGKTLTFRALILRFMRRNIPNPTEEAKKYLIA